MKKLPSLFPLIFLAACATSPAGLKENPPDYVLNRNFTMGTTVRCLVEKIEEYPVLVGFDFEDRTLPVQLRQFDDKAEMLQMQGVHILSYIEVFKTPSQVRLYISNGLFTKQGTTKAYSGIIDNCAA